MKKHLTAFTLVEALVSLTVLAVLGLVMTQMITAFTGTTRLSNRALDAASQARLAFDRLDLDLKALVKRRDARFAAGERGNALTFISGAGGGERGLSVVAYRTGMPGLRRGAVPVRWREPEAFMGLTVSGSVADIPATLLPREQDFEELAAGVARLAIGFQLYPDGQRVLLQDGTEIEQARGQIVYSPPLRADGSVDLARISALVTGVACLAPDVAKLLTVSEAEALAGAFATPPAGKLPVSEWSAVTGNPASLPAVVPLPARQGVRVYQRFYPVTPCK